jgi:hypothetical protein
MQRPSFALQRVNKAEEPPKQLPFRASPRLDKWDAVIGMNTRRNCIL